MGTVDRFSASSWIAPPIHGFGNWPIHRANLTTATRFTSDVKATTQACSVLDLFGNAPFSAVS
jgi:hypothetical protein